jgi:AmiR/NasT family two-component response regulator
MNRPLRVVVADDEPDMLQYLETTLPLLGHQVVASARTGSELVEQCRATRPDLVITDIKMPGLDGIDAVVQSFREAPAPVILVSGYQTPDLIERAGADCVFAYLVKPIKEGDLGRPSRWPCAGSGSSRRWPRRRASCGRRWRTARPSSAPRAW